MGKKFVIFQYFLLDIFIVFVESASKAASLKFLRLSALILKRMLAGAKTNAYSGFDSKFSTIIEKMLQYSFCFRIIEKRVLKQVGLTIGRCHINSPDVKKNSICIIKQPLYHQFLNFIHGPGLQPVMVF